MKTRRATQSGKDLLFTAALYEKIWIPQRSQWGRAKASVGLCT
ncbi:MAG: hypothetical protein ACUVS3_02515 [Thermodesulfobacteriota bacterium]